MILLSLSTKLSMSSWSRQALNRVISEMQVLQDGRLLSRDVLESCLLTLELVCREYLSHRAVNTLMETTSRTCISEITLFSACLDHELILNFVERESKIMCHVTKSCDHLDENDWEELDKMAPHKNAPL